ncbi:tautomerase family protein [Halochromatium roseum]|uniref:tautomerase family protein n=1 Tax=Halochromatium roseum TaxID=391920 RepID=UPI0019144033|nr:4-oxalocrotonate tautomerase [Halochromatium roseum]
MPHVIVKLWPGKTDEQKSRLTEAIVRNVTTLLHSSDESVSVAIQEVASDDWTEQVVEPDVLGQWDRLTKKPGYVQQP